MPDSSHTDGVVSAKMRTGGSPFSASQRFSFAVSTPAGPLNADAAIAATRAGAVGILACGDTATAAAIGEALERLRRYARGPFGLRLSAPSLDEFPEDLDVLIVPPELVEPFRSRARRIFAEVADSDQAAQAVAAGADGLVANGRKGAFALLQSLLGRFSVPVWAGGGIGPHSLAACYAAGAAGVWLEGEFRNVSDALRALRDSLHRHIALARKSPPFGVERRGVSRLVASDPAQLRTLLENGARQFILEGSEAGFEWWDSMIDALLEGIGAGEVSIAAAVGIEDARSTAAIAAMAAPLTEKGVRIVVTSEQIAAAGAEWLDGLAAPADVTRAEKLPPAKPLDVAIVGMGCLLPKAPNARAFWANILNKVDAITEIPRERFNPDIYYDADRAARDKIYSRWGGFLDDVPFDPMRYGIPPNALGSIDPLQLLSLVAVDQALRDAGYHDREFPREKTSAIFGLSGGLGDVGLHYALRSTLPQFLSDVPEKVLSELPEWTEDSFAGLLLNVAAGRVANRFNLGGVNFTVDAACASSLAAVYLAARELADYSSDMVLAGGVDTAQSPFGYLCFSKAQALSGRGRCRTFDQSADGIAISEGVSMVVLKRLEDAERDGDRIYAVIKGVAGSSDGKGRSMTAPRHEGQVLALRRAYAQAGIRPSSVGLIEAHGTGTAVGDAAEIGALNEVFGADGALPESCAIGSVKSMVGHTKSAAGITSLIKVAMALHKKTLPATLHVSQPNAKLREPGSPFFVNTETRPWVAGNGTPRRAGVSAFGFGGTNFHAVLEEYQGDFTSPFDRPASEEWPAELFLWHNPTAASLDEMAAAEGSLRELAAGLARRQPASGLKLAIVATSIEDLRTKLDAAKTALEAGRPLHDPQGIYSGTPAERPKVAFLFPGQGSQHTGMLREMALCFPEFRETMERAERVLDGRLPKRLGNYVWPPPVFTPEEQRRQERELTDTVVAQPALGTIEMALHHTLARLGVKPDMTAGHSYGEYVALCAAGVLSEAALLDLSEARGRAIVSGLEGETGTMAAVQADAETVARALGNDPAITLANRNSPRQTVISGATGAVRGAVKRLEAAGLAARQIPVACAFHSPLMQPARDRLAAALERAQFAPPTAAVYSNTLGARYPQDPGAITALLAEHLVRPVRFVEQIRAMHRDGARIFVEVGPKGVLTGLARHILEGTDARLLQTDTLPRFLQTLAQLAVEGVPVDTAQLFRGRTGEEGIAAPRTAWLVSGLKAFPRSQPPQEIEPMKAFTPAPPPPAAPALVSEPAPAAAPPVASAAQADAVMLQFQQLMSQFLQTQASIMTAYLQGAPAAVSAEMPAVRTQAPAAPEPQPVVSVAAPVAATPLPQPEIRLEAPPVAPPAPAAAARRDYVEELRRIASERTGYPADMLDLNANIEADLGIDSIKRVEILSAFQSQCTPQEQTAVQSVLPTLTAARTLREIADRIAAALPGSAPAEHTGGKTAGATSAEVARFTLVPVAKLRHASKRHHFPGRLVVITDDETGIAAGLAEQFRRAGEQPLLLRHSSDVTLGADDVFTTDLSAPAAIDSVIEEIRRKRGRIGALIHLLPLRSVREPANLAEWRELVQLDVRSLYALARACESDLKQGGPESGALLATVTGRGGDFGLSPQASAPPAHNGAADFTKTLALEFPGVLMKVIDLDPSDPVAILQEKLIDELTSADDTLQVGLPGDHRLTVAPRTAPLDHASPRLHIGRDWVLLITGGARGVTAEIARLIAERHQPTLILAGTSPLPSGPEAADIAGITETARLKTALLARLRAGSASVKPAAVDAALQRLLKDREIRQTVDTLRQTGARVEYHAVDVRDEDAFGGLIDRIYHEHGRLDMVIHGAGIIEDRLIRDKTPESFDRVVHTKADSVYVLSRKLRPETLKCLLLMSSISAAFGNRGQADYAAANGIMNGMATALSAKWLARVVSMNWGPWDQSGMVSNEVRQQFLSSGVHLIPLAAGAEAALREIESGPLDEQLVVLGEGPWRKLAAPANAAVYQKIHTAESAV